MSNDIRRHPRIPYPGLIRLSWQDSHPRFAQGRCLDISTSGIRMECPAPIPVRSYVVLRSDRIGLVSNASVRHCTRAGGKYILGLEFSGAVRFRDPELTASFQRAREEAGVSA
jgi:PilZ domain